MTDQKQLAEIFNDFMALYLGKGNCGIKQLCEKYDSHPMLLGLLSNMDEALKLPVPQVMKEAYQVYRKYREVELEDKDWQEIVDTTREISQKWKENKWCCRVMIQLTCLLEADDKERRRIAKEVEKEMEEAMKAEDDAA